MTTEQLNQARAEAWRQAGNPLLTADDAADWLRETGVCFFLPRAQQLATAAPSFVEAVLGASDATPSRAAIETATRLLERLLASGDAIALNLLGNVGLGNAGLGTAGEQPDFLATSETLPFLFALIGDKEWKRGPRGKSSPLVIEVWKLLDREGPLSTIEVKEKLGRQLTEAAALRALGDLWSHLRIEPVLKAGESAAWQLLERARQKQMQAGSTMSQAVALSALVSLYLQSAVAASGEEIEVFLSPLASRSKVREVVRGLTATRQLSTLNLGPVELYHVEGSLPEFAEIASPAGAVVEAAGSETGTEEGMGEGRRRFVARRLAAEADETGASGVAETARPARDARPAARDRGTASDRGVGRDRGAERATGRESGRPGASGPASRPPGGGVDRRPFVPSSSPRTGTGGERRPYGTRAPRGSSFNPREPWKEDSKPAASRGDGPAASGRDGQDRRPFAKSDEDAGASSFARRKPFVPREGGERKPFAPRAGDRPFTPRAGAKPFGDRKSFGERKPFTPRESGGEGAGERKSYAPRPGGKSFGDRKSFPPRGDGERRPFTPREGGSGDRKPFKPSTPRTGDRPFKPRFDAKPSGERKPFTPRDSERKSFTPRTGDRPFKPGAGAKPFGERKSFDDRKPFTPRDGGPGERKPFAPRGDRPFKPSFKSGPGAKPFGARPSFGDRKPFKPREGGKPFAARDSRREGERQPFAPRSGDRPFKPRSDAPSGEPRPASARPSRPASPGARKVSGFRKTGTRLAGSRPAGARPRTSPLTSTGKPRSGVRPPTGRPGPRATRGGVKRTGRPDKGRSK